MSKNAHAVADAVATLGEALERIRLQKLLTWEALAAEAGVSLRTVYRVTQEDDYTPQALIRERLRRYVAANPPEKKAS